MVTSGTTQTLNSVYTFWYRQDKFIFHAIVVSVRESIISFIATAKTSPKAWEKLTKIFASKAQSRKLTISTQEGRSVADYMHFMKNTTDGLALAQTPGVEEDLVIFILNGLGSKF